MSYSSKVRDLEERYRKEKKKDNSDNWAKQEMTTETGITDQDEKSEESMPKKYLSEGEAYDTSPRYSHTTTLQYTTGTYMMIFLFVVVLGLSIAALVIALSR